MPSNRLVWALWVRLIVVLGFGVWVATQQMWLITAFAAVVAAVTGWQLVMTYRRR